MTRSTTRRGVRAFTLSVASPVLAAALTLPAAAQVVPQPPVHHSLVEPGPQEHSTLYGTGQTVMVDTQTRWKLVCGSNDAALTRGQFLDVIAKAKESLAAAPAVPAGGVTTRGTGLNLVFNVSGTLPTGAQAALDAVAAYVDSQFSDPITVTINVSFASLSPGVLGATSSSFASSSWSAARAGLVGGMDPTDSIQTSLPSGSSVPVRFNGSSASITNVNRIYATRANYMATIGTLSGGTAASMTFSTNFSWDFDPTNGIAGNRTDFQSVVVHEVGHALGFVSNVDGGNPDIDLMDVFRFQRTDGSGNFNPDTLADLGTTGRLVDFNNPDDDHNTDLISVEYRMSDGSPWQASHFREQSSNIGIMDPAMAPGESFYPNFYRTSDLNVLDAIGWDYPAGQVSLVPVAVDDSFTINEGAPFTFAQTLLFANDHDADNDPFTISAFTQPSHGTLVDNMDGTFTYTPDQGFVGVDTFTYTLTDNDGSSTATVTLNVMAVTSIFRVDQTALAGADTGLTWTDAFLDLQTALAAAGPGDQIWVAAGTYRPASPGGSRSATFLIPDGVSLYGGFPVGGGSGTFGARNARDPLNQTILSGDIGENDAAGTRSDNAYHVVTFATGAGNATTLDGFTIAAGQADGGGTDQSIGAGALVDGGGPAIHEVIFMGNHAQTGGGAVFVRNASTRLSNASFAGNTAGGSGGAVEFSGGTSGIDNGVFTGNTAGSDGGAVFITGPSIVSLTNGSLADNDAAGQGGAVATSGATTVNLRNTVMWANSAAAGAQAAAGSSATLNISSCDVQGGQPGIVATGATLNYLTGNVNADPKFMSRLGDDGAAGTGDEILAPGPRSALVDAGDNSLVPGSLTTDRDGDTRKIDATKYADTGLGTAPIVDIGAYEAAANLPLGSVDLRINTTIYDDPAEGTGPIVVPTSQTPPYTVDLYVEAQISGDPNATGLTTFDGLLSDDLTGSFAPAVLTSDEAFGFPAGTAPDPDTEGRAGLFLDYRDLLSGGSAGNTEAGNGAPLGTSWSFVPIDISPSGVSSALNTYGKVYKFEWTTSDVSPRTVTISASAAGAGYQSTDGLQTVPTVGGGTFQIQFVESSSCPCELDGDAAQVNVFDLLTYLSLWFPQNGQSGAGLSADFNGSGNVDVFDLLDYLSCWFPASAGSPCP